MTFTVYLSGPISGVPDYKKTFDLAELSLTDCGLTVLNPAALPEGMTKEQYMRINFASIDAATAVMMLPGWENSDGAKLERAYCEYISKPVLDYVQFRNKKEIIKELLKV